MMLRFSGSKCLQFGGQSDYGTLSTPSCGHAFALHERLTPVSAGEQAHVLEMSMKEAQIAQRNSGVATAHAGQEAASVSRVHVPEAMQRLNSECVLLRCIAHV